MPTREKLESALRNAHKAGDVSAARTLANELRRLGQPKPTPARPTLDERARQAYGLQDYEYRGTLLPFGVKQGKIEFALPQWAVDVGKSMLLPGHVMKGGTYTPKDVAEFTLGITAPATGGPLNIRSTKARGVARERLESAGHQAYQEADDAGIVISQPAFSSFADDVAASVVESGYHPRMHPKINAALDSIMELKGQTPSLKDAELRRRIFKSAASSNEPDERRLAKRMIAKMDEFLENLDETKIIAGEIKGVDALKRARSFWSRSRKSEAIEDLVKRAQNRAAQFSGSGYENALRTEFRQLSNNAKKMRTFSQEEQRAIRRVARGGPMGNALRMLGKFSPTSGVINSVLGGAAGYAVGGPIGAIGLPAVGWAARRGAESATSRKARIAEEIMRMGGRATGTLPTANQEALARWWLLQLADEPIRQGSQ